MAALSQGQMVPVRDLAVGGSVRAHPPVNLARVDELIDETVAPIVPLDPWRKSDRRTRKRLATKQAILRAAWRLFMTVGYDVTTVQDITEAADVGKGTFFSHFQRKADVALHLCQHRRDVVVQLYRQGAFGEGSAASRIVRLLGTLARMNAQPDPEARIMATLVLRQFFAEPVIMQPGTPEIESILAGLVGEGIQAGEFGLNVDPHQAGQLLYAAFYSTKAAWLRPGPHEVPFDLVERVESAVRTVLRGLAADPGAVGDTGSDPDGSDGSHRRAG